MQPTLESAAILIKFTQDVFGRENIWDTKFLKSDGSEGYPS